MEVTLFIVTILLLGLGLSVLMDGTSRGAPSCKCGQQKLYGAQLMDGDKERIEAVLNEMCPTCNAQAMYDARQQLSRGSLSEVA